MCTICVIRILRVGIFDMCHVGHMKQFEQALMCTRAHRLIVGVISDEVKSSVMWCGVVGWGERKKRKKNNKGRKIASKMRASVTTCVKAQRG